VWKVAAHAPDPAAGRAGAAAGDAHGEDVLTAPVEQLGWDAVTSKGLRLVRPPDLDAVHVRLVRIGDLPELEPNAARVGGSAGLPGGELKPRPVPRYPYVARMPGAAPASRDADRLPRVLVEFARAVARVVARPEAPRPRDRVHVRAHRDGGGRLALDGPG